MRRVAVLIALVALSAVAAAAPAAAAPADLSRPAQPALAAAHPAPEFVRLGSRFRFGSSRGYGYGYRRRPSFLHRAVKTAIWLYVLHLFFTHGGLSILLWIVIIGLVLSLVRRRRRGYAYR